MPRLNFNEIPDSSFQLLPEGEYRAKFTNCEIKTTQAGDERWDITLSVTAPVEYFGANIFDRLFFTTKALPRVKLCAKAFGVAFDSKEQDFSPEDLDGKEAMVEIKIEPYTDKYGQERERNVVTFAGYRSLDKVNQDLVDTKPDIKVGNTVAIEYGGPPLENDGVPF